MEVVADQTFLALKKDRKRMDSVPLEAERFMVPPFIVETVRMAAIDHIESYRELFQEPSRLIADIPNLESSDSWSLVGPSNPEQSGKEIRKTIVQAKLVTDLTQLCQCVSWVEDLIERKRSVTWASQGIIAIGAHLVLSSLPISSIPAIVSLAYYPVAAYMVGQSEASIQDTRRAHRALQNLLKDVQEGRPLREKDVTFAVGQKWNKVPWKLLPASVEAYD